MKGMPITEYVCLRPKMYSILTEAKNIKKSKGTKKYDVKQEMRHVHYKEAFSPKKPFRHEINMLSSEEHEIHGVRLNKISLSPFDSKRYIAEKRHRHICILLPFDRRRALCFTHGFSGGNSDLKGTTNNSSHTKRRLGPSCK